MNILLFADSEPQSWLAILGAAVLASLPAFFTAMAAFLNERAGRKAAAAEIEVMTKKTDEKIQVLTKDVNSKMDRLLKTTGEAEHAKGVLEGKGKPPAAPPNLTIEKVVVEEMHATAAEPRPTPPKRQDPQ